MRKILGYVWPLFLLLSFLVPVSAFAAARTLSLGLSGSEVTTLQNQLVALKYLAAGHSTGYFGALTQTAVEKFQCAKNIMCSGTTADGYGVVGPQTLAALQIAIAPTQPAAISGKFLTGPATGHFEVSGWVPDWRAASGTVDVLPHLKQMTSVMPFGYTVSSDGHVVDTANITQGPWPALIAAAKADKTRVVPTIEWGHGTEEQAILSNATTRVALEDEIANLVKQNGFDGIDIDFEAKQAQTINYFSTFLKGLYARLGSKWLYCTIEARMPLQDRFSPGATIPDDATEFANDYTQMNKYCDRIEIMAYDQSTADVRLNVARQAPYAPVADPGWVEDVVSLAAQSISRNKIILGIPTYGYEYQVSSLPGSGYEYSMLWPFNPPYALQIAQQLNITPTRNSAGELGFIYNPSALATLAPTGANTTQTQQQPTASTTVAQNAGSQVDTSQPVDYVTWSDAQAIADKVILAHRLGLRGVAVFSLGGAEDQGMWSVLK
jgi:spore germination protein YaaH